MRYSATLDNSFDLVNYDSKHITAFCVYYWLEDSRENHVTMNGYDYM